MKIKKIMTLEEYNGKDYIPEFIDTRKAAQKIASAKYRAKKKDGLFRVYMLKCGYVGQTNNIDDRMRCHRYKYKRDTSGFIVLHTVETREHALRLEEIYHSLDFKGATHFTFIPK